MNFNFGEVLRRAWQITWKHKALWVFGALPMVLFLFYVPLFLYYFLTSNFTETIPDLLSNPGFVAIVFIVIILTVVISLVLQVFSRSATTFGIVQIEAGNDRSSFGELFNGGRIFFWRILGGMLLVNIVLMVFFAVFSACLSLVGFATLGIGSLIGQLLFLPARWLGYAVMEQTQVAIVAEAIRPTDAILRASELVKQNIEIFALVTIVLYFGLSIVGSIVLLPVAAPLFLAVLGKISSEFSNPSVLWVAMSCFIVMMPAYLLVQAVVFVYIKSIHIITYLRLTRSPNLQPLPGSLEAAS